MPTATAKQITSVEEKTKFLAEAKESEAAASLAKAEARKETAMAKQEEILLRAKERVESDELAKDDRNHVYIFDQDVSGESVKECITRLTSWSRQHPKCDIEIQINSPGGDVIEGFALIDFLGDLRKKGEHKVDIVALGMAASMAGVILQAGDTRIMGKNAILLIHEASFGAIGSFGKVEDRVKMVEIMHKRILEIFSKRAQPLNAKTTVPFIKKNWSRKDWWMDADDALKLGFVDEVR